MIFELTINNVQHIKYLNFTTNLSDNKIICLAGKNSAGKTTLMRAVRNLYLNNTYAETAAPYIFENESQVHYKIGETEISFTYNNLISMLDTRQNISDEIKNLFLVELSIPHGERFNQFGRLIDRDAEIRSKIAVGDYSVPNGLIAFLSEVYGGNRFQLLRSVEIKGSNYYFILKDEEERYYIREDYLSSGEYFVINLYRHLQSKKKLIFIDEIDISLDASAQVKLLKSLRIFCITHEVNIIFTTHSLALMKTLEPDELFYMEYDSNDQHVSINNRSYNFIKSVLYSFTGYDKYILTEDKCLEDYIKYLINSAAHIFYEYQVIYVAGGSQVVDLLSRNITKEFLSSKENVMAILDGDQVDKAYHQAHDLVEFLPFLSIEEEIYDRYMEGDTRLPRVESIEGGKKNKKAKNLFWKLTKVHSGNQLISHEGIYEYLEELYPTKVTDFKTKIVSFLNQ